MLAKTIAIATALIFSLTAYSQEGEVKILGFECAENYRDVLKWLGLYDDYPNNIVEDLLIELLKLQPNANVYEIECKSEPFYVAMPHFNGTKIIAGKTQEVSISFSLSMKAKIPPDRDRTLHIDMRYFGDSTQDGNAINIQRRFSVVGNVKNKI